MHRTNVACYKLTIYPSFCRYTAIIVIVAIDIKISEQLSEDVGFIVPLNALNLCNGVCHDLVLIVNHHIMCGAYRVRRITRSIKRILHFHLFVRAYHTPTTATNNIISQVQVGHLQRGLFWET